MKHKLLLVIIPLFFTGCYKKVITKKPPRNPLSLSCLAGDHIEAGLCVANVRDCTGEIPHSLVAVKFWEETSYGPCVVSVCEANYNLMDNLCEEVGTIAFNLASLGPLYSYDLRSFTISLSGPGELSLPLSQVLVNGETFSSEQSFKGTHRYLFDNGITVSYFLSDILSMRFSSSDLLGDFTVTLIDQAGHQGSYTFTVQEVPSLTLHLYNTNLPVPSMTNGIDLGTVSGVDDTNYDQVYLQVSGYSQFGTAYVEKQGDNLYHIMFNSGANFTHFVPAWGFGENDPSPAYFSYSFQGRDQQDFQILVEQTPPLPYGQSYVVGIDSNQCHFEISDGNTIPSSYGSNLELINGQLIYTPGSDIGSGVITEMFYINRNCQNGGGGGQTFFTFTGNNP